MYHVYETQNIHFVNCSSTRLELALILTGSGVGGGCVLGLLGKTLFVHCLNAYITFISIDRESRLRVASTFMPLHRANWICTPLCVNVCVCVRISVSIRGYECVYISSCEVLRHEPVMYGGIVAERGYCEIIEREIYLV